MHVSTKLGPTASCSHAEVVPCILVQAWVRWELLHCFMR